MRGWPASVSGSGRKAALRLGISQAGVSQHVRQLEESLGASLLDRATRPAHPTASGQRLYEQARDLLSRASHMTETVRALSRSKRSLLRLGCVDSFAATIGPQMVRGLAGRVQRLRLVSGINPGLAEQFDNHQLDVLITTDDPKPGTGRECLALFSEQFVLAVPSDFQFHMEVARATGNRHFADLMTYLGTMIIPRTRINTADQAPEGKQVYLERVHSEHERIYKAIRQHDTEAARAAMRTHLANSRERLRKARDEAA